MVETPTTWWIENINQKDELKNQVSSTILKLLFKKQIKNSAESDEKSEQEININIQWSIKWPDKFWNYVLTFDGKKILLDENLNDITWLEFVWITPYNDKYYICDLWKKCVFFNTQTWDLVEFAEVWQVSRAKIYGKDELCDDEYLCDLCNKSIKLFPNENKKTLILWFYAFLSRYYHDIIWKDIDIGEKIQETSEFGKECKTIFSFLFWIYEYMYNWKITNFLAWKDSEIWDDLKESELLKEMYPDLYLGIHELNFLKNVLIDKSGNVCGYVVIKNGVCSYFQTDWTVLQYDDFIWPDEYGNIITKQKNKKYFINSNFQYPFCGFDEIIWPDKNWNYILKIRNKQCFLSVGIWKILNLSDSESNWNEPNFTTECFDSIHWPDKNNNYVIKSSRWYFLVNSKWERISNFYLSLELNSETWNYKTLNMDGVCILNENWWIIK